MLRKKMEKPTFGTHITPGSVRRLTWKKRNFLESDSFHLVLIYRDHQVQPSPAVGQLLLTMH